MTSGAHVVALGARTPVGLHAEASAAAVRAGIGRVGEHPDLTDGAGKPLRCAWDSVAGPRVTGVARLVELTVAALSEVIEKVSAQRPLATSLPVFLAVPEERPGFGKDASQALVRGIGAAKLPGAPSIDVELVSGGHAGALKAIELALIRMSERKIEACIVGGVDSYLDADTLDWLESDRRVAREGVRGGFSPGEAAGMLAIVTRVARSGLGLPSLAIVRGIAVGQESRTIDNPEGLLGEGLGDVVRRATKDLRLPEECVEDVYCDINGERHRSDDWGFALMRVPSAFRDGTEYVSAVGNWGDVGAASGVLGCVLAIEAWRRGYAKGPRALVCASSDKGLRGAALLQRGDT